MFIDILLEVLIGVLGCLVVSFLYITVDHKRYIKKLEDDYNKNSEVIANISNKTKENEKDISGSPS